MTDVFAALAPRDRERIFSLLADEPRLFAVVVETLRMKRELLVEGQGSPDVTILREEALLQQCIDEIRAEDLRASVV